MHYRLSTRERTLAFSIDTSAFHWIQVAMERPTGSSHLSYTMAGLTALGGVMGFARTASTPSLVAGVAIGGLFAYGGYLIQAR